MLLGLLVQQVKEVLDSKWHGAAGAENHLEEVVHKLLQGALWGRGSTRGGNLSLSPASDAPWHHAHVSPTPPQIP